MLILFTQQVDVKRKLPQCWMRSILRASWKRASREIFTRLGSLGFIDRYPHVISEHYVMLIISPRKVTKAVALQAFRTRFEFLSRRERSLRQPTTKSKGRLWV